MTKLYLSTSLLLSLLALPACGSTDDPSSNGEWATGPLYVGSTRMFSADGSLGYMYRLHSLDGAESVDLKQAVELEEDAWVFGKADPYFYTAAIFAPEITQWSLDASGNFVKGAKLNFANQGVGGTFSAAFAALYSKDKSYFVDNVSGRVIVWNPEKMLYIDSIPLDLSLPESYGDAGDLTPSVEFTTTTNRVLITVTWGSQSSGWTETATFSRLIVLDPRSDAIVSTEDHHGCESLSPAGSTSDGTVFFSPWDFKAAVRGVFGAGLGASSCGLRVVPGGKEFDESYRVDLSTLVDGKPAGSAFLEDDQHLLLHVWDNDLVNATSENWIDDKRWEAGYLWYRWTLGAPQAELIAGQTPSSEGGSWQNIDSRRLSYSASPDFSQTTFTWLESDGSLTTGRTVPGYTVATIRAR